MDEMKKIKEHIFRIRAEDIYPFPYENLRELQDTLHDEFVKNAPKECITGDLNTYWMYIAGLASGGVDSRLADSLERYKMKTWLEKSFYDWFPKYRFLERYDLSDYEDLNRDFKLYDKLRLLLLELIRLYEERL